MEHLSRRTTRDVQHLLVVSDPTQRGLVAAERIASFRNQMDIKIEQTWLIVNRMPDGMPAPLQARIEDIGIPLLGVVPSDEKLMAFEFSGRPLIELGDDSPVYTAVAAMMQKLEL
jgi:CO dehydrogenase maturation factor